MNLPIEICTIVIDYMPYECIFRLPNAWPSARQFSGNHPYLWQFVILKLDIFDWSGTDTGKMLYIFATQKSRNQYTLKTEDSVSYFVYPKVLKVDRVYSATYCRWRRHAAIMTTGIFSDPEGFLKEIKDGIEPALNYAKVNNL